MKDRSPGRPVSAGGVLCFCRRQLCAHCRHSAGSLLTPGQGSLHRKRCRIWETLNLLPCADSITETKKIQYVGEKKYQKSPVHLVPVVDGGHGQTNPQKN